MTNKQELEMVQTMDATVWARNFVEMVRENPSIATDEGTMIGWFANAIMAGYDRRGRHTGICREDEAQGMY